jgi:hypothetical protein
MMIGGSMMGWASEIEQGGHSVVSLDQAFLSQSFDVIEKVVRTTGRTAAIEIELEDAAGLHMSC